MAYHILNGDALTDTFLATGLSDDPVICREALVEGSLAGFSLNEFFESRIKHFSHSTDESREKYIHSVIEEFNKILLAPDQTEFNLWFGYDLFCRVNMFFIISLLYDMEIEKKVYIINPSHLKPHEIWRDFGGATVEDLKLCYKNRVRLSKDDLLLGNDLWFAFKSNDLTTLERLSNQDIPAFPYLHEVCTAHIDRFPKEGTEGRPEKIIREIIHDIGNDFNKVFVEFFRREGVYGFGDLQVQKIYNKVLQELS